MKKTRKTKKQVPKRQSSFLKLNKKNPLAYVLIIIIFILLFLAVFFFLKIESLAQPNNISSILRIDNQDLENKKADLAKEELLKKYSLEDFNLKIKDTDFEKLSFEKNVPILMYHYIESENSTQSTLRRNLSVTPENFEKQVKWFYDNGFKTLTLSQYFSLIAEQKEIPQKSVLITIDDGYRDFFENGAPILNRYNMTATIFIITGSVGYPAYMDWDQIKLLSDQGFEFGSHSISHPKLTSLKDDKLKEELIDSKKKIENETGKNVNFFCYPMGYFDSRVEIATRNAGYKGALTTMSGSRVSNKNMFELPRFRVTHTMVGDSFVWLINSAG